MVDVQPALMRDALTLRQWRNEASVRRWSGNRAAIGLVEHLRWFWRVRSSARYVILIGVETDGSRVGTVQYREGDSAVWVVSVTVAPGRHGQGYGTALLTQGEAWLCGRHTVKGLIALIRPENAASLHVFGNCGFSREDRDSSGFERLVKGVGEQP
ncbi:MAG TPA: hypothetical protein DIC65_07290 [Actinobacteria bacterium]|nr:hypothetical protein [Actinomycetota bacterium]